MYDIIGDIHGYAKSLRELLQKLGYQNLEGVFHHPEGRQAIFVGDLIDRGPEIPNTLHIVKAMCDNGHAQCIMGNHEYNAICFHTPHIEKGGFFRDHSWKEIKQHLQTLEQFHGRQAEWENYLEWFKSMPLYLELPHFRVVHAWWNPQHIEWIQQNYTTMDSDFLSRSCDKRDTTGAYRVIEDTLKGIETDLPHGITISDKDGNPRKVCRIKWWAAPETRKTLGDILIPCPEELTQTPISPEATYPLYQSDKPVFFGHYALKYAPAIENSMAICTDYNITHGGHLVACRVDVKNDKLEIELIY